MCLFDYTVSWHCMSPKKIDISALRCSRRSVVISSHNAHPRGSPSMHRVPRPGGFSKHSIKCFILGSYGLSLLIQWWKNTKKKIKLEKKANIYHPTCYWKIYLKPSHLKKVNCCPYIQGLRVRLGYSPKGGTIMVKISAIKTKLAGRTIWNQTVTSIITTV